MIGRELEDRVEGRVIVAFYREKTKEKVVPMTETHRGRMTKLHDATCIIEVPFKISGVMKRGGWDIKCKGDLSRKGMREKQKFLECPQRTPQNDLKTSYARNSIQERF